MLSMDKKIPVCKPKLPLAKEIFPYLERIDSNRFYSNFGPIVKEFEVELEQRLGLHNNNILTTSNGTSSLELCLKTFNLEKNSVVLCPTWTFIATAQSILNVGLKPLFIDVNFNDWCLDMEKVNAQISEMKENISAIIVVSPFGTKIDINILENFSIENNIKIIIDAAAMSIDDIEPSKIIPQTVSLHATKLLNCAEGGLIISEDDNFIVEARSLSNFGISSNGINENGNNFKMSEYHAAIGLCSLKKWPETSEFFFSIAKHYKKNLSDENKIRFLPDYGVTRFNSFCIIQSIEKPLLTHNFNNFETKKWWREGCHREPLFSSKFSDSNFPITNKISSHYLGLPCFSDLKVSEIDFICEDVLKKLK